MGVSSCENALGLRPVTSTIIVIVDGLGTHNIVAAKAHARFLAPLVTKSSTISTVFPSTTAAALPSFTTGTMPGQHGMVGYKIRVPSSGVMVNQLTGLDGIREASPWLLKPPLYSRALALGIRPVVVAKARFASTSLTKLIHDGAEAIGAASIAERCDEAVAVLKAGRAVVVIYVSELDELAHAQGVGSHAWASKLEEVDSELRRLSNRLPSNVALLVTADHGVLDIASHAHVSYGESPESMAGISAIGGEPRCLQLYVEEDCAPQTVADSWRELLGDVAFVATREAMIESGWLGKVSAAVTARLGDVFVLARKDVVFFDARDPTNKARKMIGHHGGISPAEMQIPLIRLN